ncbi:MAG: cupin domain-containing protein [Bacilli bacterium]
MYKKELSEIKIEANIRGVDSRVLVDHENAIIKELILKPYQEIPIHKVPVDVTFFVLRGTGKIRVGKDTYDVKEHSIVVCPKNTEMSVEANGNLFSFLNIKTPAFKPKK